jgi:Na+/proline symporter
MNKGRLIGGVICLALAALLTVLILVLPSDEVVFMIDDDTNAPYIPVIILAVIGVVSLVRARRC